MSGNIKLTVHTRQPVKALGDLYGIFFEDLNHAADGGLYAEMVQNRSFEYDRTDWKEYHALTAWERIERDNAMTFLHVEMTRPLNQSNLHYLVMDVTRAGFGGVQNQGYNAGMVLQAGKKYDFSCWYRLRSKEPVRMKVLLESADGKRRYAEASFVADQPAWSKQELTLTADADVIDARLTVGCEVPVSIALDMISLFPQDTFHGRKNGMRADLAQRLADMKPRFMRFPGGCITHCGSLDADDREGMYRWKKTLGPVEQRRTCRNIWRHNQTFGLGFFEYFQLCEDIGCEPMPVIPGAWDPHTLRGAPLEDMQEWIDEALDLIEFASGDASTPWGRIRAEMGHPEPFHMKYLAIGNEEVGDAFFQRYEIMHRAVHEKYPEIQLIGSAGPGCAGSVFQQGWAEARRLGCAFVDEHFYQSPEWFIANAHRYDDYPADGPKAFLGEYASRSDKWRNALAEAAFMIGMEKAPGLGLACYAPLFCNADYVNWNPDLIWFNGRQSYGTPSYYVQKLMMNHQGDTEAAISAEGIVTPPQPPIRLTGEVAFCGKNCDLDVTDVRLTNADTGETVTCESIRLCGEEAEHCLADIDWTNYTLTFKATRRLAGDEKHYVGGRPFVVEFGRKDKDNCLRWIIDGWTNLTSVAQHRNADFCELTAALIPAKPGVETEYRMEVRGASIDAFVGTEHIPTAVVREPIPDTLYAAASIDDATGDVIVKVVNLRPEAADVTLTLEDFEASTVEIHEMAGFAPEDRNTFAEPEKVVPAVSCAAAKDVMHRSYPAESLTILRFCR